MKICSRVVILSLLCVYGLGSQGYAAPDPYIQQMISQLSASSYQDHLNYDLYTHAGDNRGWQWDSGTSQYKPSTQHDLARDNILNHFSSLGLQASLDPFTFSNYSGANNVIGFLSHLLDKPDHFLAG